MFVVRIGWKLMLQKWVAVAKGKDIDKATNAGKNAERERLWWRLYLAGAFYKNFIISCSLV